MSPENKTETVIEPIRSIKDVLKDLARPVADRHLRKRKHGGKELIYITWHDAVCYLDFYCPFWNYEVRDIQTISGKLVMTVRLSITCLEGVVYREATGQEDEDLDSYGDPSSNAESMALRRSAAKFGLGRYLYSK